MKFNQYQTLVNAESALRSKGFTRQFVLEDEGMRCVETQQIYRPKDMRIVEHHRFEGMSNPADMSILFAIICRDGEKGTIVSSYGPKVNMPLVSFLEKVKILRKDNLQGVFVA